MSKVYTDPANYRSIAAAIRAKLGVSDTYKPAEMAQAIRSISPGAVIQALSVVQNGTYSPPSGVDGYAPVTVNVPSESFVGTIGYNGMPVIDLPSMTVDFSSATQTVRAIKVKQISYSQLSSWEICCSISNYSYSSAAACIIGTAGSSYYANPSLEFQSSTKIWAGCSTNGYSWGTSFSFTLSEALSASNRYSVIMGWNGSEAYTRIYNATAGTLIGEQVITTSTSPHTYSSSSYQLGFGNNAQQSTSRFRFYGKVHLRNSYVKENGVIVWGADGAS